MHLLVIHGLIFIPLAVLAGTEETTEGDAAPRSATSVPLASSKTEISTRWYPQDLLSTGQQLYQKHCANCHGADAEGDPNWRQLGSGGRIRPPPLNGTGHTWHHPLLALIDVIMNGSPREQANMPAWRERFSSEEVFAVIAWFQSHWSDEVYSEWEIIDQRFRP